MRVAIPTNKPGGFEGIRAEHFGHCDLFTIVDLTQEQAAGIELLDNVPHGSGGCLGPVQLLRDAGVSAIIVSGLGARPMQGFNEAGIRVYFADVKQVPDVKSAIKRLTGSGLPEIRPTQVCQGSGDCHH